LALPTEESVRIALRTQQIIAHESGVTRTADPLAGSYYLESLTRSIESRVLELLDKVEEIGGARKAIESGFVHREIQESAYEFQKGVDEGKTVIVGVNKYTEGGEAGQRIQRIDPAIERAQVRELRSFRASRDSVKVRSALAALGVAARREKNLVEYILRAVTTECTVGEISDTLRDVFGEYRVRVLV